MVGRKNSVKFDVDQCSSMAFLDIVTRYLDIWILLYKNVLMGEGWGSTMLALIVRYSHSQHCNICGRYIVVVCFLGFMPSRSMRPQSVYLSIRSIFIRHHIKKCTILA